LLADGENSFLWQTPVLPEKTVKLPAFTAMILGEVAE